MSATSSQAPSLRLSRWPHLGLGAALAFAAALLTAGCQPAEKKAAAAKPAVVVTEPITADVTDYQDFTGRLDAFKTVDVRPRVSGYITKAPFKEGDPVKEGDPLFLIDDQFYKAQLASADAQIDAAKAQIDVNEASLELARATLNRARAARQAASGLELDQIQAQVVSSAANIKLAHATLGTAKANRKIANLNVEWTNVTAPLTGRVSRRSVDPGNLVNADNTVLTTIVQDDKMYCYFDVDERTYLGLVGTGSPSKGSWLFGLKYPVMMRLATEDDYTHVGTINFLDNRLNGNSGTIRMRGLFENPGGAFKSGLFARVRLPIGAPYKAILIPDEAVQSDQGKKYVYVVTKKTDDKTGAEVDVADYREVFPGQAIHGLRVIKSGLAEGERVVVVGTQRVRRGAPVDPQELPEAQRLKKPDTPLTKLLLGYRPVLEGAPAAAGKRTDEGKDKAANRPRKGGDAEAAGGQ
jgi:RND family efflux transporter MFP subunit